MPSQSTRFPSLKRCFKAIASFFTGTPDQDFSLTVLTLLAENGLMTGRELHQKDPQNIKKRTMYVRLAKMEEEGIIRGWTGKVGDEQPEYPTQRLYAITPAGREYLAKQKTTPTVQNNPAPK